jgi:hypothetical protein
VDVLIVLVFVSAVLATGFVLLYVLRVRAGDVDHGDRLSLLPLESDSADGDAPAAGSTDRDQAEEPGRNP